MPCQNTSVDYVHPNFSTYYQLFALCRFQNKVICFYLPMQALQSNYIICPYQCRPLSLKNKSSLYNMHSTSYLTEYYQMRE